MKKLGKDYEILVHSIYKAILATNSEARVTLDEKIPGPDGPRQFDVVIRHVLGGMEFLTLIECKDYKSIVNVGVVDAFFAKIADVRGSKGVLVTRRGFSKTARQKAFRLGIELCIAGPANEVKIDGALDIPIIIRKMRALNIGTLWKILDASHRHASVRPDSAIHGVPAMAIFLESLARGIVREAKGHPHEFIFQGQIDFVIDLEEFFGGKVSLEHGEGNLVEVGEPYLGVRVEESLFFGHTSDLKFASKLVDLKNNNVNIVVNFDEIHKDSTNLVRVNSIDEAESLASGAYFYCIAAETQMDPGATGKLQVWRYPE